nr:DNA replication and repair protein RecF [Gemmatimonadota bacterium]NIR77858.1 DNA replication and repair protein RecF [Gemmatimonadota bacterium]NIT85844.1 DNA replication and repair protein RecF [Gemmatimonadota bacterium]NIU29666.1 DNA replication and repair protein RecF [Gemmatimonadota bacterium]NIU34710.1 DNA replication and repair protein RecF [Gemmatimonadota bacterium]
RHFRNLGKQELGFPPEGAALVGDNAQGKSNFLEAIYYLETFRSFRGARDDQLVAFDAEVFRVEGRMGPGSPQDDGTVVAAAFQRSGRRKKVTVDGVEPERIGDALGRLGAVIFSPADVAIVSEGPSERRRFLDIVLSLNAPGYLESLQRFRHVLSQRNAALREEEPGAVVRAWDHPFARSAGAVMAARRDWIDRWGEGFGCYYARVSGGRRASMEYDPSVEPGGAGTVEEMVEACREALHDTAERERRVGNTVVGPHRDEVVFRLEGREPGLEVREFGSGGQRRTAALALRLVEADTVRKARGREPLVLMDDVFAELDPGRGERILELFDREEIGQVILTAPKESDVKVRREVLPRWTIRDGVVAT